MSREWTTREERYILENAGRLRVKRIAADLGRGYDATRTHMTKMRREGRLSISCRFIEDEYVSNLHICTECFARRTRVDEFGVCEVCKARKRLEEHEERMHRAYDQLPKALRDRTNGSFRIQRAPNLMGKSKSLRRPSYPDVSGLDPWKAGRLIEDWCAEVEAYEVALINLDIDAVKQRKSKWLRKARKYREQGGL